MNQYEVPALMADELPEIKTDLKHLPVLGNVNSAMRILADFTSRMIKQGNYVMVRKCMRLADRMYSRGNNLVRTAVENVFVFSFSSLKLSCNRSEWRFLQARMPVTLYSLYINQVNRTGV
ncbi:DUF7674 family protein [Foetidibacter luteolus]|uniref:DUF7674 family protein n=1 Tax=Foetidibacter luteolus TaxID=2608880 RepID=UPI00129A2B1D|nr:hypothetical protein [Foetidibacter luteolus]